MVDIVGTSKKVAYRREIMNMHEVLNRSTVTDDTNIPFYTTVTGSMREGFRFEESDMDFIRYYCNRKVVWDRSQCQHDRSSEDEIFLFDGSYSPPGYGLLEKLTTENVNVGLSFYKDGKSYFSSTAWKNHILNRTFGGRIHGPCIFSDIDDVDFDFAVCLISECWSPIASKFVSRCHLWPNPQMLHDIVKKSHVCHLVPIGHKLGSHEKEEWRISFTFAERTLVYSMNHPQFLLYGLMKLFLKEIINKGLNEEQKLLSSYHIKTAVFWTLQQGSLFECCEKTFLKCFWICFKLVIKWVYEGICPNFFIPENNMFLTKIYGSAQRNLFCKLYAMYERGPLCILDCPSIQSIDTSPSLYSNKRLNTNNTINLFLKEFYNELEVHALPREFNYQTCIRTLKSIATLRKSNLEEIQALVVQLTYVSMLQNKAFYLLSLRSDDNLYRLVHNIDEESCRAIMLSAKFGSVSDQIFHAMYLYRVKKYMEALFILEKVKDRLKRPYMLHLGNLDPENTFEMTACPGKSLSEVVIHSFVFSVKLMNKIFYIDELVTEQVHSQRNPWLTIFIPPFVLLLMLEFLCYRHVDIQKAQNALDELSVLMHSTKDSYLIYEFRDISWQILGICQEMAGNLQIALYAYRKSLEEPTVNRIRSATLQRIKNVERRMFRN